MRYNHQNSPFLSDEDRDALDRAAKQSRKQFAIRHVRERGLKPWMRLVAAYIATEGNAHTRYQQLATARRIAKDAMSRATFMALLARQDFKDLVEKFTEHTTDAMREKFAALMPKVVETVEWSIDQARAKEDYKAVPAVVEPVLSRAMPKKDDAPQQPPVLIVNLGTGFGLKYADSEPQECEVEELPAPREIEE